MTTDSKNWLVIIRYLGLNGVPYYAPLQYPSTYAMKDIVKLIDDWVHSLQPGYQFNTAEIWKDVPAPLRIYGLGDLYALRSTHLEGKP